MDENVSPRRIRWTDRDRYTRLNALEVEDLQAQPSTTELRHFCYDLHQQLESAFQVIDWDRILLTAGATISLALIFFTFFPYLQTQLESDQQFQHLFVLNSLTISEFQISSDHVTGKCDATFNVSNLGDRSIYHETSVLSIFIDHELLWVARTGDFFVDIGDSISITISINKTTVSVPASFVPTALIESRALHRPLQFKLKYDGMLWEGMAAWNEERFHVYIVCGWIEMNFTNETTLTGGPANCSIHD